MTLLILSVTTISYRFNRPDLDSSIISTAFAVCIPEKIHRISVFLFRAFILESEWIAVSVCRSCLRCGSLSSLRVHLRTLQLLILCRLSCIEGSGYSALRANFLLALLAHMESAATHLTPHVHEFRWIRIQSFRRIPHIGKP